MYFDNVEIKILSNDYDRKGKPFTITSHEFNFKDGVKAKDLARFLEDSTDSLGYRAQGKVSVKIEIDSREE